MRSLVEVLWSELRTTFSATEHMRLLETREEEEKEEEEAEEETEPSAALIATSAEFTFTEHTLTTAMAGGLNPLTGEVSSLPAELSSAFVSTTAFSVGEPWSSLPAALTGKVTLRVIICEFLCWCVVLTHRINA